MGIDIKISIEVLSNDGKWIEFQPSYPSWEGGTIDVGIFEIPRNRIFWDSLSLGSNVPVFDKVIKGLPENVSETFSDYVTEYDDLYGLAHLYLKDFCCPAEREGYFEDVVRPALESKGFAGECLTEELDYLETGFKGLVSKVQHHLDCAGFPYWGDGYEERVRVVYGFY